MIEHTPLTHFSTNELCARLKVQPDTVRRSLCVKGHYLGVKPAKLPNGRLIWPVEPVNKLLSGTNN